MPIIHGSTSIKYLQSNTSSADEFCHAYHGNTWVFDERCIRFYSNSSFTIKLANSNGGASWNGTIYYTHYITGWTIYSANTEITSRLVTYGNGLSRYEVSFRGSGNTRLATGTGATACSTFKITNGSNVYCEGDLLYLLDYNATSSYSAAQYTYARLFDTCSALKSIPKMSLATLPTYCYYYTYYSCSGLTDCSSVTLPAATVTERAYYYMFNSCTNMTKAPILNWVGFSSTYNCHSMFRNCTSLTTITMPKPTTFTNYCYAYMFYGCTALTKAPYLIAYNTSVTLGQYCFSYMFYGCSGIKDARFVTPQSASLQTSTLTSGSTLATCCFQYMFSRCSNLEFCTSLQVGIYFPAITKLGPTAMKNYCYRYMYQNCSKLKLSSSQTSTAEGQYSSTFRIPVSGTGSTATNWNTGMFSGTGGSFTGAPSINTTYYGWVPYN